MHKFLWIRKLWYLMTFEKRFLSGSQMCLTLNVCLSFSKFVPCFHHFLEYKAWLLLKNYKYDVFKVPTDGTDVSLQLLNLINVYFIIYYRCSNRILRRNWNKFVHHCCQYYITPWNHQSKYYSFILWTFYFEGKQSI